MSDDALFHLARRAGLATDWNDAFGKRKDLTPETMRLVLGAIGLPADDDGAVAASLASLEEREAASALPPLVTADQGGTVVLACRPGPVRLVLETGEAHEVEAAPHGHGATLRAPDAPGYHTLNVDGREITLAVAPPRCFGVADAARRAGRDPTASPRAWGLAAQLYSLKRPRDGGLGDAGALARLAVHAASVGADALSISPVHAQFSADPDRFSPYAPSSRVMRNVLHAAVDLDGDEAAALEHADLVDWPQAGRLRLAALARDYAAGGGAASPEFAAWRRDIGDAVELHARFEALHAHLYDGGNGPWAWQSWPEAFRDCRSPEVEEFARDHRDAVDWHAWLQFRVASGLAAAQSAARGAGMSIGIVSDLAVGTDPGGSHCWSRPSETLLGVSIGAPPDLLSRDGQNWGITAFSPSGLRANGFRAFIEMVRAAMTGAGGVRIDHAMGLNRLWIVPNGESAANGAFLSLPETDLLRLLRLESMRHEAIVLGEDLGTVPDGFAERLQASGIDGMRVLWFEKDGDRFRAPGHWTHGASAMTSTHDLPTVAGWWLGRDIEWNERLGRGSDDARAARAGERAALWSALRESGAADGEAPGPDEARRFADAAVAHVGAAGCELVMLPLEDALALEEAPNLPGTTDEHPNWRRRLPGDSATLLDAPHVKARLERLAAARRA